mgnify:FL=1
METRLKQQRRQRQRKRHLKINIWEMLTILLFLCFPRIRRLLLTEQALNGLIETPLK